jgi:hypothetical protein
MMALEGRGWADSGECKALSLPNCQPCHEAGAGARTDGRMTMVGTGAVMVIGMQVGDGVNDGLS